MSKRSYQKPTIERIDLLAEQAVAASCKRTTGGGKNQTFPNPCRILSTPASQQCKTTRGS
jgi:hypothetical protein